MYNGISEERSKLEIALSWDIEWVNSYLGLHCGLEWSSKDRVKIFSPKGQARSWPALGQSIVRYGTNWCGRHIAEEERWLWKRSLVQWIDGRPRAPQYILTQCSPRIHRRKNVPQLPLGGTSQRSLQVPIEIFLNKRTFKRIERVQMANRRTYWNESSKIISQIATDY